MLEAEERPRRGPALQKRGPALQKRRPGSAEERRPGSARRGGPKLCRSQLKQAGGAAAKVRKRLYPRLIMDRNRGCDLKDLICPSLNYLAVFISFQMQELGWGSREDAKIKIWFSNRIPEPPEGSLWRGCWPDTSPCTHHPCSLRRGRPVRGRRGRISQDGRRSAPRPHAPPSLPPHPPGDLTNQLLALGIKTEFLTVI